MNNKRLLYLDMLKIISCIGVVIIHVTALGFSYINVYTVSWSVNAIFNIIVRFAVPIFVMVSGALFLNPDRKLDIKRLWKKNILNLVIIYIIWSLIYAVYGVYNEGQEINLLNVLKTGIFKNYYHLWYIPMIIGIYACIPLLKPMVEGSKKNTEYLLVLFAIFCIIPSTIRLFKFPYYTFVRAILDKIQIPMLGYIGYFVLGHYLHTYGLPKKHTKWLYVLGIVVAIIAITGTLFSSWYMGKAISTFTDNFCITTYILSITVFVLLKKLFENKSVELDKFSIYLSNISLGIYLIHPLIRDILKNQLHMTFTNVWDFPLNTIIIIVVSCLISLGISKIPLVNKYII